MKHIDESQMENITHLCQSTTHQIFSFISLSIIIYIQTHLLQIPFVTPATPNLLSPCLQMLISGGRRVGGGGRPKSRHHHAPTLSSINERKSAATSRASNYSTASTASAAAPWNTIRLGLSQKSCRFIHESRWTL